ncbi:rhodanese-like domain-containing protein [Suttonella sp. R2A3]|uniref:rhodanese-like domain-containing protein n=1 Tax=Suttonella sp. R2A3 TaxID=2908648 RepID=UPI001F21471F|nr:rhodanese-like domain-containing protein [Suttonella sp. R2A3]UJF24366.1 rhodanese-like domain-containing protein [Suttonella sp. R2A3]
MSFSQFAQENLILFLILAAAIIAIIVYELRNKSASGKSLSPLQTAQQANQGASLIDTRPAAEFKNGHIAGAKNIPAEQFAEKMKLKKDKAIILVCKTGIAVRNQAKWLHQNGYSDVSILSGGMDAWIQENLPTVK